MNSKSDTNANERHNMLLSMELNMATGDSRKETRWKNITMTFGQLIERLRKPMITSETVAEYHRLSKPKQDDIKDVGGYVGGLLKRGRRKKDSVASRSIVALDMDHSTDTVEEIVGMAAQKWAGVAWVAHATHKHTEDSPRLRFVIPLDRPALPDEYEAVARKMAQRMGIEAFDDSTYEHHRLMYWPSIPRDLEYVFEDRTKGGKPVPVDKILAEYGPDDAWQDTTLWPVSSRKSAIIKTAVQKQGDPTQKKGIVGAFNRVYDIPKAIETFLRDVYSRETDGRWTYAKGSTSKGAVLYEDGKFLYSHHSTDPAGNQLCNAFDLVRLHMFGQEDDDSKPETPSHKLPSFQAMADWAGEIKEVKVQLMKSTMEAFSDLDSESGEEEDLEWFAKLQTTKKGDIHPTYHNCVVILRNDKVWKDVVWLNQLKEINERGRGGPTWANKDTLEFRMDIAERYEVNFPDQHAHHALEKRGAEQTHHPVREYLQGLKWDGVKRVERLWIDYFGEDDNAYTRETAKCFIVGGVTRAMEPGSKFDFVPVLYGPQGIRKSTFCKVLAVNEDWFGELNTVDDQKGVESMLGRWIMEMGEMDLTNRHEIEQVKSFISATETKVRLSYRRDPQVYKRQCVFIATTNRRDYLKDSTGNRRWWPIDANEKFERTGKLLDLETLKRNRDQIWAEGVYYYRDPDTSLYLSREAELIAIERQDNKMPMEEWQGIISAFLEERAPINRYERNRDPLLNSFHDETKASDEVRDRVCIAEIWEDCLNQKVTLKRLQSNRIAAILDRLEGWTRKDTMFFGSRFGKQKGWITNDNYVPF